jgi:hypothetical protein
MKQNIEKANEIRFSTTRKYREHKDKLRAEILRTHSNTMLSAEGKIEEKQRQREIAARELIQLTASTKAEYLKELDTAKKVARKILDAGLKAPDAETLSKFERSLADVKTAVMLSPNAVSAQQKLQAFVSGINDAYLADLTARAYPDLLSSITSKGSVTPEAISGLRELHTELNDRFKTEEQIEAAEIFASAEAMEKSDIYGLAVMDDVKNTYGRHVVAALDDPEKALENIVPVEGNQAV